MPIDDRTTNRSYKLPNAGNFLTDDVQRLRDALTAIDLDLHNLTNGAPGALDTLDELAAALGDDANFAASVTTALGNRYTKAESDGRYVQGVTQTENVFTGNGAQTTFTLTQAPPTRESLLVTVDGVVQPTSAYNLSGASLILSEAPASSATIRVLMLGVAGSVQSASTLSFTQAGTGAITRTVDARLKDVISAKDFGAVGDYNTDDTAAMQAAVNFAGSQGKALYIPSGTYRITVPLRTGNSGPWPVQIIGDGSLHTTIVQWTPNANGIEHCWNPVTVSVSGTTCTVTCTYPHGLSSGSISLPSAKGPVSALPKAFLGPKTITATSTTAFTFSVASGTTTPAQQTGFMTPGYARAISIKGLAIKSGQAPGQTASTKGGTAFVVALEATGPYTSNWDDILVMGFNANGSNGWNRGAVIYGPTGVYWNNVTMLGRNSFAEQTPTDCVALKLTTYSSQAAGAGGAIDGAYNSKFKNLQLNYWFKAIELCSEQQGVISTDETHGLEGIVFDSVEAGGHHFCSHTNNIWLSSRPSQLGLSFKFINCNAELSGYAYAINGVGNVDIVGGTLLMNGGEKGNIPAGEGINYDVNQFVNCENVKIGGTELVVFFTVGQVSGYSGSKGYLFNFANGDTGMKNNGATIEGTRWTVQDAANLDVAGGIYVGSQSQNIKERGSLLITYASQGPLFTRQAGAVNCFSQSYVASLNDANNRITCDEYGNVFLMGQKVVTTDGAREAAISWPAGLFSSVDPFIQVQSNDADTADAIGYHLPAIDLDWLSTASVKIRYSATSGMEYKTHRVTFSVSGKA